VSDGGAPRRMRGGRSEARTRRTRLPPPSPLSPARASELVFQRRPPERAVSYHFIRVQFDQSAGRGAGRRTCGGLNG
jgi:hypothetical protein